MVKTIQYEKARKARLKAGAKVLKERIKLIRTEEKKEKRLTKEKEKKRLKWEKLKRVLSKKVVSKRILKPSQMTIEIKQKEPAPYVPTYFKQEMEAVKKQMFY